MTPQELKNSILQLAIQGKLVPQHAEEGTAEELYNQIQAEKQKLIKAGKIKKEKPLPAITDDEKPFEIPDSWKWVRLGSISLINGGYAFKSENFKQNGVRVIRISDFNETGFINTKIVRHIFDNSLEPFLLKEKDIILCMTGGTVGKSYFVKKMNEQMMTNQRVATIRNILVHQEYINFVVLSPVIQKIIKDSKNSTNDNISMETIKEFIVPLPPLGEQKRIVAKIEELLPYVERYEKAYNELQQLNKRFPGDLQKSVLQLAIQGRLVSQCPEEGNAEDLYKQIQAEKQNLIKAGKIKKEKLLPAITDDEKPFEIPQSWKWVRLGEISTSIQYGFNAPAQNTGTIKMVRISDIQNGAVQWEKVPFCIIPIEDMQTYLLENDDILFARTGGTVGKSYIVENVREKAIYAGYLIRAKFNVRFLFPQFIKFFMESQLYWTQLKAGTIATAQPNCNGKTLSKMILPLPPLAEQKRIVAKLEEILPLCDKLK
ncbi:restriction endonuclease subunit S [Phascolarctobacterium faecium]|nr:restriction endonuclease subunit S [Phascolarctobacterium faecium]MDM8109059.1 restriction endonuclease subunit S [Phascolarctobacterium faecium]